ncbi:MAG: 50S ribosomal protein L18 [Anaerolineaceae bacterium]|nr:50S ribosomal protein L18 [Anaerolineaceae bacterium]
MAKMTREEARKRRHRRVRKFISGTPERPRLNVYKSITQIYAQIIYDEAQKTIASASSIDHELRNEVIDLNRTESAKRVGELVAKRAKENGITKVVFDRGGYKYIGRVKALADAAREGGLEF